MILPIIFRGHDDAGFFAHAVALGLNPNPLRILADNQRTPLARYACLISVRDYHRMGAEFRDSGQWHYSRIEPAILDDVRTGRAVLVFDLSNEGPAYDTTIFSLLFDWIERHELPAGRCIWLSQNRLLARAATAHVGRRAALVRFHSYDYFVKLIAWRFSRVGVENAAALDPQGYLARLSNRSYKDKLLLCLNATPRLARVLTVAGLHQHHLLLRSLVSFPGMLYVKAGASLADVLVYIERHGSLEYLKPSVQAVGRMAALRVDGFREQGNDLVDKIDPGVYERTFFSLVTESDFTETGIARVTEKTVKAFCMGHPTIIIGNSHSIAIMRELGFEDWCLFDRSCETVESASARFSAAFAEILRQTQRIDGDPQAWLDAAREVSVRNHHYAVSGAFLAHYFATFEQPLVECLTALIAA